VEVIAFARQTEAAFLQSIGASVTIRRADDGRYFTTDQNNLILDAAFGPLDNPAKLAQQLNERAGIVEHGLFLGLASEVIVAATNGIRHLKRNET